MCVCVEGLVPRGWPARDDGPYQNTLESIRPGTLYQTQTDTDTDTDTHRHRDGHDTDTGTVTDAECKHRQGRKPLIKEQMEPEIITGSPATKGQEVEVLNILAVVPLILTSVAVPAVIGLLPNTNNPRVKRQQEHGISCKFLDGQQTNP